MFDKGCLFALTLSATLVSNAFSSETMDCEMDDAAGITGVWRVVEATTTLADGTVEYPYGQPAAGLFVYTPGGHLSLHLRKNPPAPRFDQRPTDSELGAVAREYIGYYGTWSVSGNSVIHHIDGAMLPNRIGQDAERPFAVCGDTLKLNIQARDGRRFYRRLERVESFED